MNQNFNKNRTELWKNEMLRLFDLYEDFLTEFNLTLHSCSMERIVFCNDKFFFNITYAYDRYQMESNTDMPLAMIIFGNSLVEKSIIDVFNEKITTVDIYNELRVLNEETNNQDLTYKVLLTKYIAPLINNNQLF